MKLGIITQPDRIAEAAQAGFAYAELNINDILRLDEVSYYQMTDAMDEHNIRAEVLHGILPDETVILGDRVSSSAIGKAMDDTIEIAKLLGADTLVFDCPAARRIPAGFDPVQAWRQMGNFTRKLQSIAASSGLRIALMPMQRSVCHVLRHLSEAAMIPSLLQLDRVGVAASLYHMSMEAESLYELRNIRSLLMHMRISNTVCNTPPARGDGMDYERVITILRDSGYEGRISIEGTFSDFGPQAVEAFSAVSPLIP